MRLHVAHSPEQAAAMAAAHIAAQLRSAIGERRQALLAVSGGSSAALLFSALARELLDWSRVQAFQVDERVAARGSSSRNLTAAECSLISEGPLPRGNLHAMPVDGPKLGEAASQYERILKSFAGEPPILDVIHLGLGTDGHTASLFPGDSAIKERKTCVAVTDEHAGFRRMTLTLPVLNSARSVTWLVTGAAKAAVLSRLVEGSLDAPAGWVRRESAVVFAERMPGGGFAA